MRPAHPGQWSADGKSVTQTSRSFHHDSTANSQRSFSGPPKKPLSRLQPESQISPLSKPALKVVTINIEGFSEAKSEILSVLCHKHEVDVICVQETHRDSNQMRPLIPGYTLVAEIPHPKHGSAMFVRPNAKVVSTYCYSEESVELITLDTSNCTITSVYKPPGVPFQFRKLNNFDANKIKIVVGDFNSHSESWGYQETDADGLAVEEWADAHELMLIHNAKLSASFNSCRWRRGYNPDLIFCSSCIAQQCFKFVCPPIPRTQHRPLMCIIQSAVLPVNVPFRRRFNYTKADWVQYAKYIDDNLVNTPPTAKNYDLFAQIVTTASRKYIPRGCRTSYIPGLSRESADLIKQYEQHFSSDPFSEETIRTGEELLSQIGETRRERWTAMVTNTDLTHNSKKAWNTIRKLTGEPPTASAPGQVTADQVAHQLLLNGKTNRRSTRTPGFGSCPDNGNPISKPFLLTEITIAIKSLKNGKAYGVDNISVEQLKNLGPVAISWLLVLFNHCLDTAQIPRLWRKAKVIALLKPGKPSNDPKNYRPISLLCHTYKLLERMLLNRLTSIIDQQLIPEQAGFRPGKSCCNQSLNLTQHIEDGFELGEVTGAVFVDLSAAYDTVNIKRLLWKVTELTGDHAFTQLLSELLRNRRYQVHLLSGKSRWRSLKNGLPQGSVLAPMLFNIYTNDQPCAPNTKRFIYADDLALTSQAPSFEEVERNLSGALEILSCYYKQNSLRPNPSKTQSCAFHLRNREAQRALNIHWESVPIAHCSTPKYLGITLDRTLTFKQHCINTKQKVCTRNNLLRRLTSSKWGASPQTLRTTGLALSFSAGEYASPVWSRSAHTQLVNTALNDTCRIITGCLKPTPVGLLYPLAGVAPPDIRRDVASSLERFKKENDPRHPLYHHVPVTQRLKSRHNFLKEVAPLEGDAKDARLKLWKEKYPMDSSIAQLEQLPPGHDLPWATWKSLNRLRTQVGRSKENMHRWGFSSENACLCGISPQTMAHLLTCHACPYTCTREDLYKATDSAISVAEFWSSKI